MDSIIIRYKDNSSVHYDGKDYLESLARVQREKSTTGALQIGENVRNSEDKIVRLESHRNTYVRSTVARSLLAIHRKDHSPSPTLKTAPTPTVALKYPVPAND